MAQNRSKVSLFAVYGAGTGLGVAHLVHVDKRWVKFARRRRSR
ncbi:glucokinase [Escherichia coli]|nr:glucokinase [Escherichia coli]